MPAEEKVNWAPLVIGAGALGMVGLGVYYWTKEKEKAGTPSSLTITSYQNLRTGRLVSSPNVLDDVMIGDTIRVNFEYGYFGLAITGQYHVAVWKKTLIDPHDEFASMDSSFSLPDTPDKKAIKESIDIVCQSWDMTPDIYGLYIKIMSIPGPDVHYYLANVVRVIGGVPGEVSFNLSKPTVTPSTISPGTNINILCPVKSNCVESKNIMVVCKIYEGSWFYRHGTLIATYSSQPFTISPGSTVNVSFNHVAIAGTIDKRDIEVEVYIGGVIVAESEWDDVYYVVPGVELWPPACQTTTVRNVTHNSATLVGYLAAMRTWTAVDVYFEWGKTTGYGNITPKQRLYAHGQEFEYELRGMLSLNTTYHFRAVAEAVVNPTYKGYGLDMSFKTLAEAVYGFGLGVLYPPTGAATWEAYFQYPPGGPVIAFSPKLKTYLYWNYTEPVPPNDVQLTIMCHDVNYNCLQFDSFPYRLRDNKLYEWNFAERKLYEFPR